MKDKDFTTPFEHWWGQYPGFRKANQSKCRVKFEKLDISEQRLAFIHVRECIERHPDWQDPQFICAPLVYLNQRRWENAIPGKKDMAAPTEGFSRDTTNLRDPVGQKINGLQKMIEMLEGKGADASAIKQQLQEATGDKYGTG